MGFLSNNVSELVAAVEKISLFKPEQYLDPGSGSFIIQILLASLVGIGFAFRSFWGKLLRKITGKTVEDIDADIDDDDEE